MKTVQARSHCIAIALVGLGSRVSVKGFREFGKYFEEGKRLTQEEAADLVLSIIK